MAGWASALAAADNAPTDGNPYSVICVRNVFHLNDPPPPPPPPEPKPVDLPKVMLTAFVGKGSSIKVYLAVPPKEAKESVYYTSGMVPDQMEHDVKLVKINYEKKDPVSVDILNSGTPQTLTLKSNTYLATATAPAAPAKGGGGPPGMPAGIGLRHAPPGMVQPPAAAAPGHAAAATPGGGNSAIVAGGGSGSAIIAGGGGNSGSSYGGFGSSSGTIISGGGATGLAAIGNAAGNQANQIANSLFTPTSGQYQRPGARGSILPPEVQAAGLLLHQQMGGPPAPVEIPDEGPPGGGPPAPP
jgi:hypothetical protein